jgi:hypothetical protein
MNHPPTLTRRLFVAAALGAGTALVAACGGPSVPPIDRDDRSADPPSSVTPSVTASHSAAPVPTVTRLPADGRVLPRGWRLCVNTLDGFSVGYPGGWHTTEIRPQEACRQFHPTVFTIPPESEYPLTALNVGRVEGLPGRADTIHERVLLWEETTVSGRRAVRSEIESTGEGLHPVGTRWYGYTFRIGHDLVRVFAAAEPGATRYSDWKIVVDQAARTLRRT